MSAGSPGISVVSTNMTRLAPSNVGMMSAMRRTTELMSSITPSRGRKVCSVLLSLLQAQLGEHGYAIGIRHIALHVLPCDHVLKFRNQWNQADIAIGDFL